LTAAILEREQNRLAVENWQLFAWPFQTQSVSHSARGQKKYYVKNRNRLP